MRIIRSPKTFRKGHSDAVCRLGKESGLAALLPEAVGEGGERIAGESVPPVSGNPLSRPGRSPILPRQEPGIYGRMETGVPTEAIWKSSSMSLL